MDPPGDGSLLFEDCFEKGKPLTGWTSKDIGYVSDWYNAKVGLLVQDGRSPGNDEAASILLSDETLNRRPGDVSIDAQIRQLGDVGNTAVGVVFGYEDEGNYLRYEERKSYRFPQNRFRRLVNVRDGCDTELASDLYESDYIPTHIYFRIMEDIRIEVLKNKVRIWHDNVRLWDLVVPDLCPGAAGLYCRGRGIFAFKRFSVKSIGHIDDRFFQKLPYLQNPTSSSVLVGWETSVLADSMVEYGPDEHLGSYRSESRRRAIHRIRVEGLQPDTRYFYRVRSNATQSDLYGFRTPPEVARPFTFCVIGDTHSRPMARRIADNIRKDHPDFVVNVGDAATDGRLYGQWNDYFDSMAPLFSGVPSYHVLGNHESTGGNEANLSWFYRYFSHPGFTDHYAFTYCNCRFIVLNNYDSIYEGSQQHEWLLGELKRPEYERADFRMAFFHEPGYCTGWGLQSYDGNPDVRTILIPLFERHGLDAMFSGHSHDYERGRIGEMLLIITGGGGGGLDSKVYDVDCFQVYANEFHHVRVDVTESTMSIAAVNVEGRTIDGFEIRRRDQSRPTIPQLRSARSGAMVSTGGPKARRRARD